MVGKRGCILLLTLLCGSNFSVAYTSEEKEAIITRVYERVYNALGNARMAPELKVVDKYPVNIAFMRAGDNGFPLIGFETQAFDVCAEMGNRMEDAIAFLLGHEICHYYFNHNWGKEFSSTYSLSFLDEITSTLASDVAHDETEADVKGGMLCYLAGYDTKGIAEPLLRRLYEVYKIKSSPRYPSLDERISIAKTRDSLVSDYIRVYETANFSMMVADYELATKCYEYILGKGFHHPAIYNNLGVACYFRALKQVDAGWVKYFYPVGLDMELQVSGGGTKGNDEFTVWIKKALKNFDAATRFNSEYALGYLNLACMYAILGENSKAEVFGGDALDKAKQKGDAVVTANARLLVALLDYQTKDTDLSKSDLKLQKKGRYEDRGLRALRALAGEGHYLAQLNLEVIEKGDKYNYSETRQHPLSTSDYNSREGLKQGLKLEKLEPFTSYSKNELKDVDLDQTIVIDGEKIVFSELDGTELFLFKSVVSNKPLYYVFHKAKAGSGFSTVNGLKANAGLNEIKAAYGTPNAILGVSGGVILSYTAAKVLLYVDQKGQLKEWVVWRNL